MKSKIQKTGGQVVSILIAMAMLIIGTGILPQESVQAAERVEVTDKIHIGVGYEGNSIKVYSSDEGDYVKNIKTSSKNLAAKITSVSSGKNYTFDNKGKTRTAISLTAISSGDRRNTRSLRRPSGRRAAARSTPLSGGTSSAQGAQGLRLSGSALSRSAGAIRSTASGRS